MRHYFRQLVTIIGSHCVMADDSTCSSQREAKHGVHLPKVDVCHKVCHARITIVSRQFQRRVTSCWTLPHFVRKQWAPTVTPLPTQTPEMAFLNPKLCQLLPSSASWTTTIMIAMPIPIFISMARYTYITFLSHVSSFYFRLKEKNLQVECKL